MHNLAVDPVPGAGMKPLVIAGARWGDYVGTGTWYYIDGTRDSILGTQSGVWRQDATSGSSSDFTTFTLDEYAALSEQMAGWYLQPDINRQVYLPITEADPQAHTLTTSGSYEDAGEQGTRFRIHAPASAQINGPHAGTQGQWISATSSRCLYNGYRFESPLTGYWDFQANQVANRQGGNNFAGLHYTLHRHYDPNLTRFTSPDPIASPSSNLGAYAANNPARMYDPDGLEAEQSARSAKEIVEELIRRKEARGGGPVHQSDMEEVRDGASQAEVVYQTGKAINGTVTGGLAPGADYTTAGKSVHRYEGALIALPDVFLLAGGLSKANKLFRFGDDAVDIARGSRAGGRVDEIADARRIAKAEPKCFVAGTQVLTADEYGSTTATNIEDIEVGDWVWSRNEDTGEEGFKPVTRLFRNETDILVHLTYTTSAGEATLLGTEAHPFWSLTRQGWIGMGELEVGEQLLLAARTGTTATVTTTRTEYLSQPVTVYNFEVADWHTYHVGTRQIGWVYVHNLCKLYVQKDALGRPTAAVARIRPGDIGMGTRQSGAAQNWVRANGSVGDDAGHIVGRLLGGGGGTRRGNVFAQNAHINRGQYRIFEERIADYVRDNNVTARVRVTLQYAQGATRPHRIDYRVIFNDRTRPWIRRFRN